MESILFIGFPLLTLAILAILMIYWLNARKRD